MGPVLRFTVLASGSAGNASLLEADGFGVLLDVGLGPRMLAARLHAAGASWQQVQAAVLTHTHGDHCRETTIAWLCRYQIPLYCHAEHAARLAFGSTAFRNLRAAGLVRLYESGQELALAPGLLCWPLPVRHDGGAAFGFRFEATGGLFQPPPSLGYVADLGSWTPALAGALADVDLLALEFNHDVDMQYTSGRSHYLIERVLGDEGHLSNEQAADLLRDVLLRSGPDRIRHVVQLHLSRDCNRPALAGSAARRVARELDRDFHILTASQDEPSPTLQVGGVNGHAGRGRRTTRRPHGAAKRISVQQRWLPGFED